jgi:hypothetical protein
MHDCRHDLDELLASLAEYWTEEHEIEPEDLDHTCR